MYRLLFAYLAVCFILQLPASGHAESGITGEWEGYARSGGVDLFVRFEAKQEDNHVEGNLNAHGPGGGSAHKVTGEFHSEDNTIRLQDTLVEKQSGSRKFEPTLMEVYELKLKDKGMSLVGSCYAEGSKQRIPIKLKKRIDVTYTSVKDPNDERSEEYLKRTRRAFELGEEAKKLVVGEQYKQAEALYRQAVQLDPNRNSASIHCDLGVVLEMQKNYSEAMREFEKALVINPKYATATFNMATCLLNSGSGDEAKKRFEKFITEYPNATEKAEAKRLLTLLNQPWLPDMQGKLKPTIIPSKPAEKFVADADAKDKTVYVDSSIADEMDAASDEYRGATEDYYGVASKDGAYRWRKEDLPLRVYIESGDDIKGYKDSFRQQLISALDAWMKAANYRLSWKLVVKEEEANVVCRWMSDTDKFMTKKLFEQSETFWEFYNNEKGTDVGLIKLANVNICTNKLFGFGELTDKHMNQICMHEVGHVLGIIGHSPNSKDVMYQALNGVASSKKLTQSDIETINRLYAYYPTSVASTK